MTHAIVHGHVVNDQPISPHAENPTCTEEQTRYFESRHIQPILYNVIWPFEHSEIQIIFLNS